VIITLFNIALIICFVVAVAYCFVVLQVSSNWKKIPEFGITKNDPSTPVSIIIAARNEEKNIVSCLNSLLKQNYPKHLFELIVVDDDSTDSTAVLVQVLAAKTSDIPIKLIKANPLRPGKKNAISTGIENTNGKLIITTDADCVMGNQWLSSIVSFYEKYHPKMIIGPVVIHEANIGLEFLQSMEMMSLMAFTAAFCYRNKPIMSNGANLAYERSAFMEVKGFEGIDQLASGDDVLLMNKFANKFPGEIKFLRSQEAIVSTKAQAGIRQFINQRIRWSSKGIANMSLASILVAAIVGSINIALSSCLFLSFFYGKFAGIFLMLLALKSIVDYALLNTVSDFFKKRIQVKYFLASQLLYSFYVMLILFLGMRKRYEWKGRKVE
jgi:biofilm PGA synthesis N-glycosyltransferase PgaC